MTRFPKVPQVMHEIDRHQRLHLVDVARRLRTGGIDRRGFMRAAAATPPPLPDAAWIFMRWATSADVTARERGGPSRAAWAPRRTCPAG
jgi:hypothetical protein